MPFLHSAKTRQKAAQIVLKRGRGMQIVLKIGGNVVTFYISLIPTFYISLIPTPKRAAEPPASRSDLVEETFLKTSDWQKHGYWEL